MPFCIQVGHTVPMAPSETGRPIPYIDQVALDFPELVIVGGHIGYPWTEEMVSVARKYPRVFIDTSAYTAKRYPPELVRYMTSRGGRRKVMFGSNYPMIAPEAARRSSTRSSSMTRRASSSWAPTLAACSVWTRPIEEVGMADQGRARPGRCPTR